MPTNRPGYMQEWWQKNREAQLAVRRYRLKNDPDYRERKRAANARYLARKAAKKAAATEAS